MTRSEYSASNWKIIFSSKLATKVKIWETLITDEDSDGKPDHAYLDENEDGTPDVKAYDYDQDGKWDKYEKIS